MAATATVATSRNISQYWGGRPVNQTSTGQWWVALVDQTLHTHDFFYSNDQGDTWTEDTGGTRSVDSSYQERGSFWIDEDDIFYHASIQSTGQIRIQVGTVSGNAITWNANTKSFTNYNNSAFTMLAFPESTGRRVAVIHQSAVSTATLTLWYFDGTDTWSDDQSITFQSTSASPDYLIDFNHTGDGKTVSGTPHLYISRWANGTTSYGKATWASGDTWSMSSIYTISSDIDTSYAHQTGAMCFDGTRIMFAGFSSTGVFHLLERNEANTTTNEMITGGVQLSGTPTWDSFLDIVYDTTNQDYWILANNEDDDGAWIKWSNRDNQVVQFGWRTITGFTGTHGQAEQHFWMSNNGAVEIDEDGNMIDGYAIYEQTTTINGYDHTLPTGFVGHGEPERQPHIDRNSSNVLFVLQHKHNSQWHLAWNDNNGADGSWRISETYATWSGTSAPSMFIDADDYIHVLFDEGSSAIKYVRGTWDGTDVTWSAEQQVLSQQTQEASSNHQIIAHREGTGWKAHCTSAISVGNNYHIIFYARINITSGGTITVDVDNQQCVYNSINQGSAANSGWYQHAMDWNHDGGGKIVKTGEDEDIYMAVYCYDSEGTDAIKAYKLIKDTTNDWPASDSNNAGVNVGTGITNLGQFGTIDLVWDGNLCYVSSMRTTSPYREVFSWDPSDDTITDLNVAAIGATQTTEERQQRLVASPTEDKIYYFGNDTSSGDLWYNVWDTVDTSWSGWTNTAEDFKVSAGYWGFNRWARAGDAVEMYTPNIDINLPGPDYDFLYRQFVDLLLPAGGVGWGWIPIGG